MAAKKGASLEEAARSYFQKQGYFALRSVPFTFDGEDVTDIDVWLYGRQAASGRIRAIVDAKDKRSPKALERILWTKGLQSATKSDRAIIATTDSSPKVARFARANAASVITKSYLDKVSSSSKAEVDRITLEQFYDYIKLYKSQKSDGDWINQIEKSKEHLVTKTPFQAFNSSMSAIRFFCNRIETKTLYQDQAFRCALLCSAIACISLDAALEKISYETKDQQYNIITNGVVFGDEEDRNSRKQIKTLLDIVKATMENGGTLSYKIDSALEVEFGKIRSDIIAEYFINDTNSFALFGAARELEELAHSPIKNADLDMSLPTKGILAVFLDHLSIKRSIMLSRSFQMQSSQVELPLE